MLRHCAKCSHCGRVTAWSEDVEESRREVRRHLEEAHGLKEAREPADYLMAGPDSATIAWSPIWTTAPSAAMISAPGTPAISTGCAVGVSDL